MRFFFGLVLGVVIGIGGSIYFFSTGGGDYVVASSPRVLRLEEDLRQVVAEREHVVGKLEEATLLIEQMAAKFTDLERRFQSLERTGDPQAQDEMQTDKQDEPTGGADHTKESEDGHAHQHGKAEEPAEQEPSSTGSSVGGHGAPGDRESHLPQPQGSPEAEQTDPTDGHSHETSPSESSVDQQGEATESTGHEGTPTKTPEGKQSGSAGAPS